MGDVVGTVTRLGEPGFESQQGQEIISSLKSSRPDLGPTQPPLQWVPDFFHGGKASGV
jgi:hypothetical protein